MIGEDGSRLVEIIQGLQKINKIIHGDYDMMEPMMLKQNAMKKKT